MKRVALLTTTAVVVSACTSTVSGQATAPSTLGWQRNVTTAITMLGTALGPVGDAMVSHDLAGMARACSGLSSPIDQIERLLPTPDSAVTAALRDSVSDYRSFARACLTLDATPSPSAVDKLSEYLVDGDDAMRTALHHMGIELPDR